MKRKILHIPRGGLPAWTLAEEPDTIWHARARNALYIIVVTVYGVLLVGRCFGAVDLSWAKSVMLGYFVVMGVPTIQYGVRPGKGKAWLISLAIVIAACFMPPLIILAPLVLLGVHMWRSGHSERNDIKATQQVSSGDVATRAAPEK